MSSLTLPNRPCALLGHPWEWPKNTDPGVLLEVYIDFLCPFSERIFKRLVNEVLPHYNASEPVVKFVLQQIPQPWHPQGTHVHECVIAVRKLYGIAKTNEFIALFFAGNREEFVDSKCQDLTRNQIIKKLATLAGKLPGVNADDVEKLMIVDLSKGQNSGGDCTRVLKFYVKQHRQLGIHVSPTCRVNNIIVDTSSGWTLDQWREFLDPMVAAAKSGWKRG
eukprot:g4678.t1